MASSDPSALPIVVPIRSQPGSNRPARLFGTIEIAGVRVEPGGVPRRQLRILSILLCHDLLGDGEQFFGDLGIGVGQRPVAQFIVGIVLEWDRWTRRIESEWILGDLA